MTEDFVLIPVVFSLFVQWVQFVPFHLNQLSVLQENFMPLNFFLECFEPPLIFLFAVALDGKCIFLHIENPIDDAFEELFSFTVAIQIFAHAKEKVESVFQKENASEKRIYFIESLLKIG